MATTSCRQSRPQRGGRISRNSSVSFSIRMLLVSGFGRNKIGARPVVSHFLQENGKRPVWPRFIAYLPIAFNRSAFVCGVFVLWTDR